MVLAGLNDLTAIYQTHRQRVMAAIASGCAGPIPAKSIDQQSAHAPSPGRPRVTNYDAAGRGTGKSREQTKEIAGVESTAHQAYEAVFNVTLAVDAMTAIGTSSHGWGRPARRKRSSTYSPSGAPE
jgi:hypothetical protein